MLTILNCLQINVEYESFEKNIQSSTYFKYFEHSIGNKHVCKLLSITNKIIILF